MGRTIAATEVSIPVEDPSDLAFPSSRLGGAAVKRYTHADPHSRPTDDGPRTSDRRSRGGAMLRRSDPGRGGWGARKGLQSGMEVCFYCAVFGVAVLFVLAITMPQKLMRVGQHVTTPWGIGGGGGGSRKGFGELLRFMPVDLLRRFEDQGGLDGVRSEPRFGVRPPRLGVVIGTMKRDASSLMLLTLVKSLHELGYSLKVYAVNDGEAYSLWEQIGCQISILNSENVSHVDWSIYEGIILSSLEAKHVMSSLMQEPFYSVPVIWIIHEDTLAKRLPVYAERGWMDLISDWRSVFSRADVVVFPDFSFPMLHSALDTGNFFVISGSPVDAWAAEIYLQSHSRNQLRKDNGFQKDDLVVLVIGSTLFYDELPWDYAAAMHVLGPRLMKLTKMKGPKRSFKFVFLCGNSTDGRGSAFQEIASHLGFAQGSIRHYGLDSDVNGVLLMSDIALYASFHDEQSFPPLLTRAMTFGIPIVSPDLAIIKKYVVDKVNGLLYRARNVETLTRAFSLLVSEIELSELAHAVATSGKLLSKNMFALDCLTDYVKLLENVVFFPSDTILPHPTSQLQQHTWEWSLFEKENDRTSSDMQFQNINEDSDSTQNSSIVYSIEVDFVDNLPLMNSFKNGTEILKDDFPTESDWEEIGEIEVSEDYERREMEELEERTERSSGSWEYIYNTARKSEKKKFEVNERDEGELERIGRPLCIYEIYSGAGAWPFLHHGAIYRGISLSKGAQRSRSDDIVAVDRLPILNDHHYRDLLCELGGMFSIANKVDGIHKIPWIGFQSWRAVGRKVSLSVGAEKVLEESIVTETQGDVIYFWVKMELETKFENRNNNVSFWSTCDVLNGGNCRSVFEDTLRKMYGLPSDMAALPPMPADGDHWSALHSWVMPTPSFLEFIMFSRMFVDSLHILNYNSSNTNSCLLGSSKIESKHCYCRVLEFLVNVWAYHSARKMVYINPLSGELKEQHPIEQRKGLMWAKYFNFTLLKSMDEDLAEEADDGTHTRDGWLWPLTGEVHWQGIFEREREERYRKKMDKHRKNMEKLIERQKYGYKQKALGG